MARRKDRNFVAGPWPLVPEQTPGLVRLLLSYPPSANHIWRVALDRRAKGRRGKRRMILTDEARLYHEALALDLRQFGPPRLGAARVGVAVRAFPPDAIRRDLGNVRKILLDALTRCGVWDDDEQVDLEYSVWGWIDRQDPRVEVHVWPLE